MLYYVCCKCKATVIGENAESALCVRCQAEVDDRNQKIIDGTKKAGVTVLSVITGVGAFVKSTINKN